MVKIKRSLDYRFKQLDDAVQSLGNSLNSFETTKRQHHLLDIMARLRALVALGGKNMTPLLFSLADEISFPLSFYGSDIVIGMPKVVTGVVVVV